MFGTVRTGWLVWIAATLLTVAYVTAGLISSSSNAIPITLTQGTKADVTVLRLGSDHLRARLEFQRDHRQRPELGDWGSSGDWRKTGLLRHAQPGAQVRISAATGSTAPVLFEAMPASAFGLNYIARNLTADPSLEPGVWRWPPPDEPRLPLSAGLTKIRFEVAAVDPPLGGETVELTILPPLGFKTCQRNTCWLWWSFFWPFLAALLAIWAAVLLLIGHLRARKANA